VKGRRSEEGAEAHGLMLLAVFVHCFGALLER